MVATAVKLMTTTWIVSDQSAESSWTSALVGGKGANLHELARLGMPVPRFICVATNAFETAVAAHSELASLRAELAACEAANHARITEICRQIREQIKQLALPPELLTALRTELAEEFAQNLPLAVRSSAADEDHAEASFAGMHDSFLFLRGAERVGHAIRDVWASAYHERAVIYRREQGLACDQIAVAVVIQRMIDAHASGVMFTCHPATGNVHQTVIGAVYGLGEGLVGGTLAADTYVVEKRGQAITPEIVEKTTRLVQDKNTGQGIVTEDVAATEQLQPAVSDDQLRQLAAQATKIEAHYSRPQDIEWAIDADGKLFILQTRPITKPTEYGPAAGNRMIWDNSNIVESYSGVTSPLTFSFIRRAYTIVYHCFAEVMGIAPKVVAANEDTFSNMLGLFRGRVYYNLRNWYRLIKLFPGYQYNARYMESMMGLKEPLELDDVSVKPSFWRKWFVEFPSLLKLVGRSLWNFLRLQRRVKQFQTSFRQHYEVWDEMNFAKLSPPEALKLYQEMERALLWNWKAPIINDFYVMIYYGLLKKLCESWCGDTTGAMQNDLICGEGGIESAQPAKHLLRMAARAQHDPELRRMILEDELESLPKRVREDPRLAEFSREMQRYLRLYGFRCMHELKLEEFSLRDRPASVYGVLRNYLALNDEAALDVDAAEAREQRVRREAEGKATAALRSRRGSWWRRFIFRRILRNARNGVKNRENMRFARTRIYGLLRELMRGVGGQLAREGILDEREQIFYLTMDEVWDYVRGTAVTTDLRALALLRKQEFDHYRDSSTPAPDERFETFGMAYHRNLFRNHRAAAPKFVDGKLRGIGCCQGVIEAPARVVHHPSDAHDLVGTILVAERTDPGWVPLYPAVKGILIERGSILSHSAVVAREMGIPTIVGISGLLASIQDGQRLRMDGQAGTVELLDVEVSAEISAEPKAE
jgi:phosphohistidine swiveling domain-containing protein